MDRNTLVKLFRSWERVPQTKNKKYNTIQFLCIVFCSGSFSLFPSPVVLWLGLRFSAVHTHRKMSHLTQSTPHFRFTACIRDDSGSNHFLAAVAALQSLNTTAFHRTELVDKNALSFDSLGLCATQKK